MSIEAIKQAFETLVGSVIRVTNEIVELFSEIEKYAEEAQEVADQRAEERKRWGHPPNRQIEAYSQPVRKIRPHARSFGKR